MKDNVRQLGDRGLGLDPHSKLKQIIAEVDDIQDVMVIIKHKNGDHSAWSTSGDRWFMWACSGVCADMSLHGGHD